jgi:hypothetical protein
MLMFLGDFPEQNELPRGHGVSINDNFYLNHASCGEFNPTGFAASLKSVD